jgi:hypothetical protein
VEQLEDRTVPSVVAFTPKFGPEPTEHGPGPKLKSAPIYLDFWGPYWNQIDGAHNGPLQVSQIKSGVSNFLGSGYLSGLSPQYGVDGQAFLADAIVDPTDPPNVLAAPSIPFPSKGDIDTAVERAIASGALPEPTTVSPAPLYMVVTPPNVTAGGDAAKAAGYHHEDYILHPPTAAELVEIVAEYNINPLSVLSIDLTKYVHVFYDGWAATTKLGASVVDTATHVLSHEIAEAVTDPLPVIYNVPLPDPLPAFKVPLSGIKTLPGPDLPAKYADPGESEIGDNEPDGGRYFYRLNGTRVQPYWSEADQSFIVPTSTDHRQKFTLGPVWDGNNNFQNTHDLTLAGGQLGASHNDTMAVRMTADGKLTADLNFDTAQFDPGQVRSVTVTGGPADATLTVDSTNAINLAGNGPTQISFVGGAGKNTLVLQGQGGPVTINYESLNAGTAQVGGLTVTFASVAHVVVTGGGQLVVTGGQPRSINNEVVVTPGNQSSTGQIYLDDFQIDYSGVKAVQDLARARQLSYSIDSLGPTRLDGLGFYFLNNGPDLNGQHTMEIFPDLLSSDILTGPDTYTFANKTNVVLDGANRSSWIDADADQAAAGLRKLTVDLEPPFGGGTHLLRVHGTPANVLTEVHQLNPSPTRIEIDTDTGLVRGGIDLTGDMLDTEVKVFDDADKQPRVVIIGRAINGLSPAPIRYADAFRLSKVTVVGGSGGNFFYVTAVPHMPTTFLRAGSGDDTILVAALGALFPANIYVDGQEGDNTLTVMSFKPISRSSGGPEVDGQQYLTITTGSVSVFYRNIQHVSTARILFNPGTGGNFGFGNLGVSGTPSFLGPFASVSAFATQPDGFAADGPITLGLGPISAVPPPIVLGGATPTDRPKPLRPTVSLTTLVPGEVISLEAALFGLSVTAIPLE